MRSSGGGAQRDVAVLLDIERRRGVAPERVHDGGAAMASLG